jgi:hypothetical protein
VNDIRPHRSGDATEKDSVVTGATIHSFPREWGRYRDKDAEGSVRLGTPGMPALIYDPEEVHDVHVLRDILSVGTFAR